MHIKFLDEYINPEDVNLSSFDLQDHLNDKIWHNFILDDDVRKELLSIANDFVVDTEIPYDKIIDVILTGSLANYNWNEKYSDLDLHIVVSLTSLSKDPETAKKYYNEKRFNWNKTHTDISILGFPVEIYVQDINEAHRSTGVYSVLLNQWLIIPSLKNLPDTSNKEYVKQGVAAYCNTIDALYELHDEFQDDNEAVQYILKVANEIMDAIKMERTESMSKNKLAELSTGNIMFKTMRRNGYIEKLINLKTLYYDELHSI